MDTHIDSPSLEIDEDSFYEGNNNNVEGKLEIVIETNEPEEVELEGMDDCVKVHGIPSEFELKGSSIHSGLGVWTKAAISRNERLGPVQGELRGLEQEPCSKTWEVRF